MSDDTETVVNAVVLAVIMTFALFGFMRFISKLWRYGRSRSR